MITSAEALITLDKLKESMLGLDDEVEGQLSKLTKFIERLCGTSRKTDTIVIDKLEYSFEELYTVAPIGIYQEIEDDPTLSDSSRVHFAVLSNTYEGNKAVIYLWDAERSLGCSRPETASFGSWKSRRFKKVNKEFTCFIK